MLAVVSAGLQVTSTRCWSLGDVDGALRAAFLEIDAKMRRDKVGVCALMVTVVLALVVVVVLVVLVMVLLAALVLC